MGDYLQAVPDELVRPVALLAGLARRPQVVDGGGYGTGRELQRDGDELPRAGELRAHEPAGTGTDVTGDARYARVRRPPVGRVLRLHDAMAGLSAERGRVHHLDPLVGCHGEDHEV